MAVLSLLPPPMAFAQSHSVVVRIESESWVGGSVFDADRFTAGCRDVGIELLPADSASPDQPELAIRYTESRGSGFSKFGVGTPEAWGTDITLSLKLTAAPRGKTLVTLTLLAETPAGLAIEGLHQGARDALYRTAGYRLACSTLAGALGDPDAPRRLLPWAVFDAQASAALSAIGFTPVSAEERAYFAVVQRDFDHLGSLGDAAVAPLTLLLQNTTEDRDGYGTFPVTDEHAVAAIARAVAVLGAIDDDGGADTLALFLNDHDDARLDAEAVAVPSLIATIRSLGAIGTRFHVPLLQEWQRGATPLATEARNAIAAIRKRTEF
jgi:hypothetical protein